MHKNNFLILLPAVLFFALFPFFVQAIDSGCSVQTPTCLNSTVVDVYSCKDPIGLTCPGTEVSYQAEVQCGANCSFNRCSSNDNITCTFRSTIILGETYTWCQESGCNTSGNCCGGTAEPTPTPDDSTPPTPTPPTPTPTVSCGRCSTVNGCQWASWTNWGSSCDPYNPATSPSYTTDCGCGPVSGGNNSACNSCASPTIPLCTPSWGPCSVPCGGGTQSDGCGNTQSCNTQSCGGLLSCGRCSNAQACRYASWTADPALGCENDISGVTYTVDDSCDLCPSGQVCSNGTCITPPTCVPNGGACIADDQCCSSGCSNEGICGGGGGGGGGGGTPTPPPVCIPSWGRCSAACGGGTQSDGCGNTRACNTQPCPVHITQFKITNFAERLDPDYNVFYIILADQMRVGFRANIRWAVAYGSSCQASCTYYDRNKTVIPVDCEWYGSVDPHYGNFKVGPTTPGVVSYTLTCLGEGNSQDSRSFSAGIKELTWQEVHPRNIVSLVLNPFVSWNIFKR